MPISVKTMRDIWDEEETAMKIKQETMNVKRKAITPTNIKREYSDFLEAKEKSLAEIKRYSLDYLGREKCSVEIFDFIEKDLAEAGFSKIR